MPYVSGRRYGTLRSEIERIAGRQVCVLELELEGALTVQSDVAGSVTIFIAADVDELERRLRERATESTGEIEERIELARAAARTGASIPLHGAKRRLERATLPSPRSSTCELARAGTVPRP